MNQKIKALLTKYEPLSKRYDELRYDLESPEIIADNRLYLRLSDEKNSLEEAYRLGEALKVAVELGYEDEAQSLYACLTEELTPKNENDIRSAIVEIRLENPQSSLLRDELIKIYVALSKKRGYKLSLCEDDEKFSSLLIEGNGAYRFLRSETGTHRSIGGKVGNSNVWVSVLPKMDDVSIAIKESDLRIDIFHSSGAGGQNINKVATAVRLTHIPTGIAVVCKEERSQLQNRNRAHEVLRARVYAHYREQELIAKRKEKNSTRHKARTEKVRLADFDADTLTDLRLNQSITLKQAYDGELGELISPLLIKEDKR